MAPVEVDEGGVKWPSSRKDLMLLRRSSEEAEGERRMIGSGRREEGFDLGRRAGVLFRAGGIVVVPGPVAARGPDRRRKSSVYFRT